MTGIALKSRRYFPRDTTHVDGTFGFDFVPALPLEVGQSVFVQDRQNLWPGTTFEPNPGEVVTLEIGSGVSVTGQVVQTDIAEWKAANVRVVVKAVGTEADYTQGPEIAATVAEDGRFVIESLAPGSYAVTATLHGDGMRDATGLGEAIATGTAEFRVGVRDEYNIELPELLMKSY